MPEISSQTKKLVQDYRDWQRSLQNEKGPTLHTDEVISKIATIYEKTRGLLDWKEEHLLRRAAIWRILKRNLLLMVRQKIEAQSFMLELIRAGHFPNDSIEELKIAQVQESLDKYVFISINAPRIKKGVSPAKLQHWLAGIAACEIEEILDPPQKELALIEYMSGLISEEIKLSSPVSENERMTQVYIAVHRALFRLDSLIITYHLLKKIYPSWKNLPTEHLENITQNIYAIWENTEKQLNHELGEKFYRICERHDTPYLLLGDILSDNPGDAPKIFADSEKLENIIRKKYQARLSKLKSRLFRAAIFSTISIFLTKILSALAIEFPFDKYITHQFSYRALAFSVAIPPLLMLFMIISARPPSKKNQEKAVMETIKITYGSNERLTYLIKPSVKKGPAIRGIIFLLYTVTFTLSFWIIWVTLTELEFSWLSKVIFIIFVSLITFAGTKVRERAKELSVEEEKVSILGFLLDWFSLPFIRLGKLLSSQWEKSNSITLVIFAFTALFDLPFQVFVGFLEQWRLFVKEKKEEIH
jgi:hypothetical protein